MFNTDSDNIENVSREFVAEIKNIFSDKLKKVILYGSYARGDYDDESDIDVMVLVDMTDEEIEKKWNKVLDLICATDNKYDVFMSPIVKDINHFNKWKNHMPFYKNVNNEGVSLYG